MAWKDGCHNLKGSRKSERRAIIKSTKAFRIKTIQPKVYNHDYVHKLGLSFFAPRARSHWDGLTSRRSISIIQSLWPLLPVKMPSAQVNPSHHHRATHSSHPIRSFITRIAEYCRTKKEVNAPPHEARLKRAHFMPPENPPNPLCMQLRWETARRRSEHQCEKQNRIYGTVKSKQDISRCLKDRQ